MTNASPDPHCSFYERTIAADGLYHYEQIMLSAPNGAGRRTMAHPPIVGDQIGLWDEYRKTGGQYRVITRSWHHPSYGSANWPHGQATPNKGPMVDIIVQRTVGPFTDQSPTPTEEQP